MNIKTRRFGKYPANRLPGEGIPTAEESYKDGYESGQNWKDSDNYVPGGPWICGEGPQDRNDPDWADWVAYCIATKENNREWLRGFATARAIPRA